MSDEKKGLVITSGRMEFEDDSGPFPTKGHMDVTPNGIEAQFEMPKEPMQVFMVELTRYFESLGAVNYLEQHIRSSGGPAYTILIQKEGGETPAAQNQRYRARIAELEAELAEARKDGERLDWLLLKTHWTSEQMHLGLRAAIDAARGTK
jgi:hypothetical protein